MNDENTVLFKIKHNIITNIDLFSIIFLSIIIICLINITPENLILRIIIGIPFLLIFPGYVLSALIWPKNEDLNELERFALSIILSILGLILMGLGLNYFPKGISLSNILISLTIINIVLSFLVLLKRNKIPQNEMFSIYGLIKTNKKPPIVHIFSNFMIPIILIILFITSIYIVMSIRTSEPFTEFYILNSDGKAESFPKNLTIGENALIIVGIENNEQIDVIYNITITISDENNDIIENREYPIALENNEFHEFDFILQFNATGKYRIQFFLFKNDELSPIHGLYLNNIIVRD